MSNPNFILALVLGVIGIFDLVLAGALSAKLPPASRKMLQFGAAFMLFVAALLGLGLIRIIG